MLSESPEPITLAKACMETFPGMTTVEYRELDMKDKVELRDAFIKEGCNIAPIKAPTSES
jgi:hypothetical protein